MSEQENTSGARPGCYCAGAGPHLSAILRECVPEATREHFRNSRIEFLKGLRSFIDLRIDHLSRGAQHKGSSVPVE